MIGNQIRREPGSTTTQAGSIATPVAKGSNRLNSNGQFPSGVAKSSLFYNTIIAAGDTLPIPAAGDYFYLTFAGAALNIRPAGGNFNEYVQGTGLALKNGNTFNQLEVQNTNAFPVVAQIFVGFDEFIDKRLILNQVQQPSVAYPTYPTANSATSVAIKDLSGTSFNDINGNSWIAISRAGIYISNLDGGVTLLLQHKGATGATGVAVLGIQPLTSIVYPCAGDYALNNGGGAINAIVSEIYSAIDNNVS